ncbi:MAG: SDR family oxidoreductase [Bacteroidia bacterium]|nr:SDR family oxidoreductase [Bacteroidia bacterium]
MSKKILITGTSGGFGKLTAKTLLEQGHNVAASMRDSHGRNKEHADELKAAGALIVDIDVTNTVSVNDGIEQIMDAMGRLDVVVNNAGVGVLGLQEQFTPEDWQKLFDINVFGVQRVNRAALPHMRNQGSGLLIQVSSLLGRMTIPFYGPYNASKWAVEALAENYRTELSGFGVDSVIVEPGGFPTTFFNSLITPSDHSQDNSYGDFVNAPKAFFDNFEGALASNPAQNPQDVADAIATLINTPAGERPFRTVVDKMGMGDPIKPYNDSLDQVTSGIYEAFGMSDMLKLKVLETQ